MAWLCHSLAQYVRFTKNCTKRFRQFWTKQIRFISISKRTPTTCFLHYPLHCVHFVFESPILIAGTVRWTQRKTLRILKIFFSKVKWTRFYFFFPLPLLLLNMRFQTSWIRLRKDSIEKTFRKFLPVSLCIFFSLIFYVPNAHEGLKSPLPRSILYAILV